MPRRFFEEEEFRELLDDLKKKGDKWLEEQLQQKKKPDKKFEGYNWITHEKKMKGLKDKIRELKEMENPSDTQKLNIKRMKSLLSWHTWAWKKHKAGWSDKRIHEETFKRRSS